MDNPADFCTKLHPAEAYLKPCSTWWNVPKFLETSPFSPDQPEFNKLEKAARVIKNHRLITKISAKLGKEPKLVEV